MDISALKRMVLEEQEGVRVPLCEGSYLDLGEAKFLSGAYVAFRRVLEIIEELNGTVTDDDEP